MKKSESDPQGQVVLPTTLAQKQLFALAQMDQQGQCAYNETIAIEFTGPFNRAAIRTALADLVQHRDCLRTIFNTSGDQQIIHPQAELNAKYFPMENFIGKTENSSTEQVVEQAIEEWIAAEVAREFDLITGPLHRFCIAKIDEQRHMLVMTYHHIITDGMSMSLCLYEVAERYSAIVENRPVNVDPAVGFADYIQWWEGYNESEQCQIDKAYWLNQYNTPVEPLNLPSKANRPLTRTFNANTENIDVDSALIEQLKTLGKQQRCSLVMVLYASYTAFLSRLCGQEDFVVPIPSMGREFKNSEYLAGYCTSFMPIRNTFQQGQTFVDYLTQTKIKFLDADEYKAYPFAHILEGLTSMQVVDRGTFGKVTFNFDNNTQQPGFADLDIDFPTVNKVYTAFDLALNIVQEKHGYQFQLHYSTDLFDPADMARFAANFQVFLSSIVTDPTKAIDDFDLLTEYERHQVLVEWNNTHIPYSQDKCVHELFEEQVSKTPDAAAVAYEEKTLTYRQLNEKANQLAHYLVEQGVTPDTLVGLDTERSLEMLIGILGIWKSGAAYVPIAPDVPQLRLKSILKNASIDFIISQSSLRQSLSDSGKHIVYLDEKSIQSVLDEYPCYNIKADDVGLDSAHTAYVIYTSGSTGVPKGVAVMHKSLVNLGENISRLLERADTQKQECWAWNASYTFDASLQALSQLAYGTKIAIVPELIRKSPEAMKDFFSRHNVTAFDCTPSHIKPFIEAGDASNLPTLLIGGEKIGNETWGRLAQLHEDFGVLSYNVYGPTESCVDATACPITKSYKSEFIGKPLGNIVGYVVKNGKLAPTGVPGELYIGGAGVAKGYVNNPELTEQQFIVDKFSYKPTGPLYKTGDLVCWREGGLLEYLGRFGQQQVKISGHRIELDDIEAQLAENDTVNECVVLASGEENSKTLVAYIKTSQEYNKSLDQNGYLCSLRNHLKQRLPDYMIPRAVVVINEWPLNSSGKVDRKSLPEPNGSAFIREEFKAPTNQIETILVTIWKKMLGLDKIGIADNFFDLGGSSVKLLQLKYLIEQQLGMEVSVVNLFAYPSISTLSNFLKTNRKTSTDHHQLQSRKKSSRQGSGIDQDIAVVSMAFRGPSAQNVEALRQLLVSGKEGLIAFTTEELKQAGVSETLLNNPNYIKKNGFLEGKNLFDAELFGYTPREASILDPQIATFQECIWEAVESAGIYGDHYSGLVGIYGGTGDNTAWLSRFQNKEDSLTALLSVLTMTGPDALCARTAYKFNFKGPAFGVQTACSTSLVALHLACQGLINGDCDFAFAGGVTILPTDKCGFLHEEGMILSSGEHCRPFDAEGDGILDGEGCAVLGLKRLQDAIADRDDILAVIKGTAINNDGNQKVGYTAPSVDGQANVIYKAQQRAGIAPESITYVEAHGTGTKIGDPIEIEALTRAFATQQKGFCAIGSLKSNVGHLDAAAGAAGVIKTILSLKHRELYPSLNFENPNPLIDFDNSPFRVNTELRPWESESSRRAGVSSFGIGGTNAHVILEEACFERQISESRNTQMLFLSANTETALAKINEEQLQYLAQHPETSLPDLCYTRQTGRKPLRYRKAIAVSSIEELTQALVSTQDFADNTQELTDNIRIHTGLATDDNKIGFLFPGQGAQYVNMGKGLYETESVFRQWMDKCFNIAQENSGIDFKASLFPTDKSDASINQTENTQPLLFMLEYSLAQQLMYWGCKPDIMIGHSVGEYVAACLAGVFTLKDAITLIIKRGALIQALPSGDMLSVRTDKATIEPLLAALNQTKETVGIAAINSPKLLVVSGDQGAIATLQTALDGKDIPHSLLHTSHAFHSHHLDPALAEFKIAVEAATLSPPEPELPYISNVTGKRIDPEHATSPDYWVQHLRGCVQFSDGVDTLIEQESLALLEVGPGQVLSTFVQQNPSKTPIHHCVNLMPGAQEIARIDSTDATSTMDQKALFSGLCKLFTLGRTLNWQAFYEEEKRGIIGDLPTYPFEGRAHWTLGARHAEATASRESDLLAAQPIENWFSIPTWQPASLPHSLKLTKEQGWLIFMDDYGVGEQLLRRLSTFDKQAIIVLVGDDYVQKNAHTFIINPKDKDHYGQLFITLEEQDFLPSNIIHLWGITPDSEPKKHHSAIDVTKHIELGFYSQIYLCQAFEKISALDAVTLKIVNNETQSLNPSEKIFPGKILSLAPGRVIPEEYSFINCQFIDCPYQQLTDNTVSQTTLIDELLSSGVQDALIAYRGGLRWRQSFNEVPLPPVERCPALLRQQGCYLITGGLGGIGLTLAHYISEQVQGTLILLTRSSFIDRNKWDEWLSTHNDDENSQKIQKLKAIEANGATVVIVTVDVANHVALAQALAPWTDDRAEGEEPIHGVFHTAGVPSQGAIQMKQVKDLEQALAAKVMGSLNLQTLLANKNLSFMILSSSQTSIAGGKGEIDYCAANLFLDAFARCHDNLNGTRYIAINWPAWKETGMATNKHLLATQGDVYRKTLETFGISSEQGTEVLARIIDHPMFPQVMVAPHPIVILPEAIRAFEKKLADNTVGFDTRATNIEYVPPYGEIESTMVKVWQQLLHIKNISVRDNFFSLGGDSLAIVELTRLINRELNTKLLTTDLFSFPTIATLCNFIIQNEDTEINKKIRKDITGKKQKSLGLFQKHRRKTIA